MGHTWSNDQKHKNNEKVSQLESGNWTLDTGHWTVQRTLDSAADTGHWTVFDISRKFSCEIPSSSPIGRCDPKLVCSPRPTFKLKHNSTVEKRQQSHFKKTQFHLGGKKAAVAFKKTHVGEKGGSCILKKHTWGKKDGGNCNSALTFIIKTLKDASCYFMHNDAYFFTNEFSSFDLFFYCSFHISFNTKRGLIWLLVDFFFFTLVHIDSKALAQDRLSIQRRGRRSSPETSSLCELRHIIQVGHQSFYVSISELSVIAILAFIFVPF